MSKLFIYYSLSGNGDYVAEVMEKCGYETFKVETKKKMPKSFIGQILTGGFLAGIENKAELKDALPDIGGYESIVIGSPVWNSRITPAINTVLDKIDVPFDFVCYSGGGTSGKVETQLQNKSLQKLITLKQPLDDKDGCSKVLTEAFGG